MNTIDKIKKYDVNPEDNIPQKIYGIPDFLKEKEQDNNKKYDVNPEENVPREVYGIPDFIMEERKKTNSESVDDMSNQINEVFVLPKVDLKTLKINIRNKKSNYAITFSYKLDDTVELSFRNLNKIVNKSDNTIEIPKKSYDSFIEKYNKITNNWKESYIGNKDINWMIVENFEKSRLLNGNGEYPDKWNEFIDLLVEYEILFKEKKK